MLIHEGLSFFFLFILAFLYLFMFKRQHSHREKSSSLGFEFPKSYPLVGSLFDISTDRNQFNQWMTEILKKCPTGTFVLHRHLGYRHVYTANPSNVQHILQTKFPLYPKGEFSISNFNDFFGSSLFTTEGDEWKFQRQLCSHVFNMKYIRKFIETVVETELTDRLIPILSAAAANNSVLNFQDILERFGFDNICNIVFGFDPAYLLPSLPKTDFAVAFEDSLRLITERLGYPVREIWKMMRLLNIGSEKKLRASISHVRGFAQNIVKEKKKELSRKSSIDSDDLLSKILNSGNFDDSFVTNMVIGFITAGQDTTSAALTWFFWVISIHPHVEKEILREIMEKQKTSVYDEAKDMVYTHASLCETMRLYPPVPLNLKQAKEDDVLPDGTVIKKGMRVTYSTYAMGRMENLWGNDWAEFKPERWLKKDENDGKLSFVGRNPYMYPVFHAGPRLCLGKEMAFLQMKRVVARVLQQFRIVPAIEEGFKPVYIFHLTSKMKDGFPVKIKVREGGF